MTSSDQNTTGRIDLFRADHLNVQVYESRKPMGAAAANLALRFRVTMRKGYVLDPSHSVGGDATWLLFNRQNELLGDHAIIRGRGTADTVKQVVAFLGQSLSVPAGATEGSELWRLTAFEPDTFFLGRVTRGARADDQIPWLA